MMFQRILLTFYSLFFFTFPAISQQAIGLDDALQLAAQNNRELKIARMDMDKADYRVQEAFGTAMPNITASGQYTRAIEKPVFFLPAAFLTPGATGVIPIEIGSNNSYQLGLTATQILFNSAVFTGVGTAKIYQKASREMYRNSYNSVLSNVKRAFYGGLFAQSVADMMNASMKNAEDNLRNVELMNKQGIVSDYDLIRAQVQVGNIRPNVMQAERNVLVAQNGMKILLGMDADAKLVLKGTLEYVPADPEMYGNAEQAVVSSNASLKALEFQTEVAREIVTINKSENLPTLAAFGNYTWQAQKETFAMSTNDFVRSSQVGLNLSFSLFNGLQSNARINQAEIDYLKSEEQRKSVTMALKTQAMTIRLRIEEAKKRIETQTKTVEQAEKGYRIVTTRYAAGSGTQLEVNDADLALMQARVNRVQAIFDYNVACADMEELLSIQTPSTSK
jgi:outer membrane protein